MFPAFKIKPLVACAAGLCIALSASATQTLSTTEYNVVYDESTTFGWISGWFGGGSTLGFNWNVPTSATVVAFSGNSSLDIDLPSFTLTANTGYALSGPLAGSLGNLVFNEFGTGSTSALVTGTIEVDSVAYAVSVPLVRTVTSSASGFAGGTLAQSESLSTGAFTTVTFSGGTLHLQADAPGSGFASIIGQDQNKLSFSFTATPVPEPETYALMLAGAGVVLSLARRRRAG